MMVEDASVQKNKQGGVTMGVSKNGGWAECFAKAKVLAGWTTEVVDAVGGA